MNNIPPLDVAVGVIRDTRGRVLVNQRPAGKSFAHKWEFPGGKIEQGESAAQSLARELQEELGIVVHSQRPFISFRHEYGSGAVLLHVKEVLSYGGVPHGREGQQLRWVEPARLRDLDLLDANTTIVRAIMMPRVCLITDTKRFGVEDTLRKLARYLEEGPKLVLVREKTMASDALDAFVGRVRALCRSHDALLCVHADCDFKAFGQVDGVHYSSRWLTRNEKPAVAGLLGVSCHTAGDLEKAGELGADYALLSPVRRTSSHPDAEPLGWSRFAALCRDAITPVYALGGMGLGDCPCAIDSGAQGVAVLSAAWRRSG